MKRPYISKSENIDSQPTEMSMTPTSDDETLVEVEAETIEKDQDQEKEDSSQILITCTEPTFHPDDHIISDQLTDVLSQCLTGRVLLVSDQQVDPLLMLLQASGLDVALAEMELPYEGMFSFSTRELRMVPSARLPISNPKSDKPAVSGLHAKRDLAFDGMDHVTSRDVEEALEKIDTLSNTSEDLWEE